jgi:hypothetical protein
MVDPFNLWIESEGATKLRTAATLLRRATGTDPRYLGGLAALLTARYQRDDPAVVDGDAERNTTGHVDPLHRGRPRRDPADLDEAIAAAREALTMVTPGAADQRSVATTLALALALRYEHSGDLADLGEALALARAEPGARHPQVDAARGALLAWAAHTYAADTLPRRNLRRRDLSGRDLREADFGGAHYQRSDAHFRSPIT